MHVVLPQPQEIRGLAHDHPLLRVGHGGDIQVPEQPRKPRRELRVVGDQRILPVVAHVRVRGEPEDVLVEQVVRVLLVRADRHEVAAVASRLLLEGQDAPGEYLVGGPAAIGHPAAAELTNALLHDAAGPLAFRPERLGQALVSLRHARVVAELEARQLRADHLLDDAHDARVAVADGVGVVAHGVPAEHAVRGDQLAAVVSGGLVCASVMDNRDRPHVHGHRSTPAAHRVAVPALEPLDVEGGWVAPVRPAADHLERRRAVAAPDVGVDGEGDAHLMALFDHHLRAGDAAVITALPAPPVLRVRGEVAELVGRPEPRLDPGAVAGLVAPRLGHRALARDVGGELRRHAAGHQHGPHVVVHGEVLAPLRHGLIAFQKLTAHGVAPLALQRGACAGELRATAGRHLQRALVHGDDRVQVVYEHGADDDGASTRGIVAHGERDDGLLARVVADLVYRESRNIQVPEPLDPDLVHGHVEVLQAPDRRLGCELRLDGQFVEIVIIALDRDHLRSVGQVLLLDAYAGGHIAG